jgi:hypothetical protein
LVLSQKAEVEKDYVGLMKGRAGGEFVATASGAHYFHICVLLQPQEQRDELCAVWLSYEQFGAGIHVALRMG